MTPSEKRHIELFLNFAKENSENWQKIYDRLEQIKLAWQYAFNEDELILEFIQAMRLFFTRQGFETEFIKWAEVGLQAAKKLKQTEIQVILLNDIGLANSYVGQPRLALKYYEKALPISKKLENSYPHSLTLHNLGLLHADHLGNKKVALQYYQNALLLLEETNDLKGQAHTLMTIGALHNDLGKSDEALRFLKKAQIIWKKFNDNQGQSTVFNSIGLTYIDLYEYKTAIKYLKQSLTFRKRTGDQRGLAATLDNIGVSYFHLNKVVQAKKYYLDALKVAEGSSNFLGVISILDNIGFMYYNLNQSEKALSYYKRSLKISDEIGNRIQRGVILTSMSLPMAKLGKYEAATDCLKEAIDIHTALNNLPWLATAFYNLSYIYRNFIKKSEKSLSYLQRASELYEELDDKTAQRNVNSYMADIYIDQRKFRKARQLLLKVIKLDQKISSPNLQKDFERLHNLQSERYNTKN